MSRAFIITSLILFLVGLIAVLMNKGDFLIPHWGWLFAGLACNEASKL